MSPVIAPSKAPSKAPTQSPTQGRTRFLSYTNDWTITGDFSAEFDTGLYDSILYINTICDSENDYLYANIIFTNFTNDFEFGFLDTNCINQLNDTIDIRLGEGFNSSCDYSTGYALLSNGFIR